MNIIRDEREQRADDAGGGTLGRRSVLGGLAAIPVLYGVGAAAPAHAATAPTQAATTAARAGNAPQAATDLVRGSERRFTATQLTPGTRLVLPEGIKAVAVEDYYHRPHTASAQTAWPNVTAANGRTVDASVVPDRGAPTRIAILSGFVQGWYEIKHATGRTDRVAWDARKLPVLFLYGEFGATSEAPYNLFYTLALQPLSHNPYTRNLAAK